jgi:hypothetical protein
MWKLFGDAIGGAIEESLLLLFLMVVAKQFLVQ